MDLHDGFGLLVVMFSGVAVGVEPATGSRRNVSSSTSRNLPYILPSNMKEPAEIRRPCQPGIADAATSNSASIGWAFTI
jgi:hypothetical protein